SRRTSKLITTNRTEPRGPGTHENGISLMNVIDQAFVKAFARRTQPQSSQPTGEVHLAPEAPRLPAADMTVHPQAAESAVMWYDTAAEDYLRRDDCHRPAAPLGDAQILQDPRSRRLSVPELAPVEQPLAVNDPPERAALPEPASRLDLSELYHSEVAFAVQPALLVDAPAVEHAA